MNKRVLLFLFGCIGSRTLLAYVAKTATTTVLPYIGAVALAISVGLIYVWITGTRRVGVETFGELIWWDHIRPVHATLYGLFAYKAFRRETDAWKYLAIDVVLGLVVYILHKSGALPTARA